MFTSPTRRMRVAASMLAVGALVGLAGCSSDKSDDTTTKAVPATTETTVDKAAEEKAAETARFDKAIQQELTDVGCHPGAVDGKLGPNTDAAILRFQEADGIKADGQLGPQTEAALKKAVAEGKKVCTTPASTTTTAAKGSTTTVPSNGPAPCTATALLKGLPAENETIGSFICSGGYAAGELTDGTKFLLQSENGQWYAPSQDPCGSASAGIDPKILAEGCPTN